MPGLVVLAEQLGRVLAPSVVIDAAVAARVAVGSAWFERLQTSPAPVALAVAELAAQWDLGAHDATVAGGRVSGTKIAVPHAASVDAYAVAATLDGAPALVFVEAGADGIEVVPEHALDPTASSARLILDDVEADSVFSGDVIAHAFAVGAVATAAEAVGAASAALDLAVAYAKEREQFGRADRLVPGRAAHPRRRARAARDGVVGGALRRRPRSTRTRRMRVEAATIAKAYALARGPHRRASTRCRCFGGIGFTWEHDLHLFLRRVLACEQRFGDALFHERQLAAALAARAEERQAATTGRSVR